MQEEHLGTQFKSRKARKPVMTQAHKAYRTNVSDILSGMELPALAAHEDVTNNWRSKTTPLETAETIRDERESRGH